MILYNSMLKINEIYYLPCWELYMDLIETKDNPEDDNFYNWDSIDNQDINLYKKNLKNNMDIIIDIVKNNIIDITNNTEGYYIENDEVVLDLGLTYCHECHHLIDSYGYCKCI